MNFKQIANAAGFIAYLNVSGDHEYWHWKNEGNTKKSQFPFSSEERAYENCCRINGLVE